VFFSGACTHASDVRPGDRSSPAVIQLEERGRESRGTIVRYDLDPIPFQSVELDTAAVVWVAPEGGAIREIPVDQARYIQFVDRGRGAVDGVTAGIIAGLGAGAVVGFLTYDGPQTDPLALNTCLDNCSRTELVVGTALTWGVVGGLTGVTIGTIIGARVRYHIVVNPF
jgi:hypothetical protein